MTLDVLPENAVVSGLAYGDWTSKWWQWAYSISSLQNPLNDKTGENSKRGQGGPVWYLGGTFETNSIENRVVRKTAVPQGKYLLIAALNTIFTPWELEGVETESELFQRAANETDHALFVSVKINGENIPVTRIASSPFQVQIAANDPVRTSNDEGVNSAIAGADGYWVFLSPPDIGTYEILIDGQIPEVFPNGSYETHVTYNLAVVSSPMFDEIDDALRGGPR